MGLEVTVVGRVPSDITLRAAVGAASTPPAHAFFPRLKYGTIRVVRCNFGVEQGEGIRERGRAPSEAMFGQPAIATATAILNACLATSVVREERCPQGQVGVYDLIRHSADDRVIAIIEGPEAIIDAEGIPARVYMIYI